MCGRFIITKEIGEITARFHVDAENSIYSPVYNASPGSYLPVLTNRESNNLKFFKWGLVPFWAKDVSIGYKMINARSETILEKPSFKTLINTKRCLVIADGYYEWKTSGKQKIPSCIKMIDNGLFAFAGLWDVWKPLNGEELFSFTIITTVANEKLCHIHDRMPVILKKEDEAVWLHEKGSVLHLLKPFNPEEMIAYEVTPEVNKVSNNYKELCEPINHKL